MATAKQIRDEFDSDVWLAYYSDFSGLAVFKDELEARRHAMDHDMYVKAIGFGEVLLR